MSKAKEYRKEFKEAWDKYKEICKRFEHDPEHPMTSRTMVMVIIEEAAQENKELKEERDDWELIAGENELKRQKLQTENKELIKRLQESQDQEMILGMAYDKYKKENKELIELLGRIKKIPNRFAEGSKYWIETIYLKNKIQKAINTN